MIRGRCAATGCVAVLLLSGCGSNGAQPVTPTPHRVASTHSTPSPISPALPTPTTTPQPTETATGGTSTPVPKTPTATPDVPPTPAPAPAHFVAATLRPGIASPGEALTATVQTTGSVRSVQMYLGSGAPNAPAPLAYTLTMVSPGTWTASGTAPTTPGEYHYTVALFTRGGRRVLEDNDGWNIQVGSAQPTASPRLSIPPELLAPPFSYGNPTPVTFNAGGQSVRGLEVLSNARADVAPSTVSTYYNNHLPRAGWTVSNPAPEGATSFSLSARSGPQVCVIQYAQGVVEVLYGTLGS